MFNVVLYTPQIPQNTGNIIRLCANTGCSLHLIQPLGFVFDSAKMRRSGLDYHEFISVKIYENWQDFQQQNADSQGNIFALTTHGSSSIAQTQFSENCYLLFGSETSGLPPEIRDTLANDKRVRLPMMPNNRSLNLANTVSIVVFEAWRQHNFAGGS
ncbi:MAG: tRNA ((34)-2-O)-methyltransferase [Pseudomonadota bacterium]|jgi:tRNA (cytidine/uridine-2'-O-)-methyltransferase